MRLIYSSLKLLEVHHLKNLLEAEGIRCHIKNELLSRLAGDIPFTECAPELWILDDRDFDRARRIVADLGRAPRASPPWQCSRCGEALEGQFSDCWRCGAPRPQI